MAVNEKIMNRLALYFGGLAVAVCMAVPATAETATAVESPHELRIGFADAFVSSAAMRSAVRSYYSFGSGDLPYIDGLPVAEADKYLRGTRHYQYRDWYSTGHFFLGYQYRLTALVSVGIDVDMAKMGAKSTAYNGYGTQVGTLDNYLYIWSVLPTVRLTYFERPHVRLYSSAGIGYSCYVGEWNNAGVMQNGAGMNVTLFGVQAGGEHVFGAVGLGAYNAWYVSREGVDWLPFSRLFSASIGWRF